MPYYKRRRTYRRKRPAYRRSQYRRKTRVPRAVGAGRMTSQVFVKRTHVETSTVLGELTNAAQWNLAQLSDESKFVNLYDQYRILKVAVTWVSRGNVRDAIPSVNVLGLPIMYHYIDLDDSTIPASVTEMMENTRTKMFFFSADKRARTVTVKPRISQVAGSAGAGTILGRKNAWLDTSDTGTLYRGIKYWIQLPQSATAINNTFDVYTTYWIQCRHAK